jgi:hypothetical protein
MNMTQMGWHAPSAPMRLHNGIPSAFRTRADVVNLVCESRKHASHHLRLCRTRKTRILIGEPTNTASVPTPACVWA